MKKIASFGVLIRVVGLVIGLSTSVLLARFLGPEQFGQYAFLLTIAELLTIIALFGTPALILREVAAGASTKSYGRVRGLLTWTRRTTIAISIPLMLTAFLILFFWEDGAGHQLAFTIVLVPISFILLGALSRQATNVIQGLGKIVASQALSIVTGPGLFLFFLLGAFAWFPERITLVNVFLLLLTSRVLALIFLELKKKQYLPPEILHSEPEYYHSQWVKSALPLMLVGSLLIINTRIDIIMLGYLRESVDVGVYRVAQRGGEFMLFGVMAIDSIISPLAAKAWAQKQHKQLQQVVTKSIWLAMFFTLPLLAVYIFFGQDLINLVYGHDYSAAWFPLVILSCGYLSLIFFGRGGVILTMCHFERDVAKAIGIGVVANIILNLVLIPRFGINGAALATAIAVTLRMVTSSIFAFKKTGINTTCFYFLKKVS